MTLALAVPKLGALGLALLVVGALAPAIAKGQAPPQIGPYPKSGLLSRYTAPPSWLPPDNDRMTFTGTRYEKRDAPPQSHANDPLRQGLYGRLLSGKCTTCYAPFFQGRPGSTANCPDCKVGHPWLRLPTSVVHPFKPVDYYYAGGCWVPMYDLDPWVVGPGTYPCPYVRSPNKGG